MKTTIEIKGYQIVIEESEDGVTVMAVQDGETVEEFTLEGEVDVQDDDMESFGQEEDEEDDFEDADEYEDEMDELGQEEDEDDFEEEGGDDDFEDGDDFEEEGGDDDFEDEEGDDFGDDSSEMEDEDEEEEKMPAAQEGPKMESFGDFVRRTSKTRRGRR
jgi:hypothetical protein